MGCWPKRLATASRLIFAFCAAGTVRAIHGSNANPRCQNTFSLLPYRLGGCEAASFCPGNTQNPSLPYPSDYSLLPPFYVVPFRLDDASKQAWRIKTSRVPAAGPQQKISNLYIYLAHTHSVTLSSAAAAAAAASCTSAAKTCHVNASFSCLCLFSVRLCVFVLCESFFLSARKKGFSVEN